MAANGSSYSFSVYNRYNQHFPKENMKVLNLHDTARHCGLVGAFFCDACSDLDLKRTCDENSCRHLDESAQTKANVRKPDENAVRDITAAAFSAGLLNGDETPMQIRARLEAFDERWASGLPMSCLQGASDIPMTGLAETLLHSTVMVEQKLVPDWVPADGDSIHDVVWHAIKNDLCRSESGPPLPISTA